eukprot:Em0023g250a
MDLYFKSPRHVRQKSRHQVMGPVQCHQNSCHPQRGKTLPLYFHQTQEGLTRLPKSFSDDTFFKQEKHAPSFYQSSSPIYCDNLLLFMPSKCFPCGNKK